MGGEANYLFFLLQARLLSVLHLWHAQRRQKLVSDNTVTLKLIKLGSIDQDWFEK